jgi:vWA domain found in the FtsH ternary systems/N-terminal helical region fused to the FtsH ternary system vWA domain
MTPIELRQPDEARDYIAQAVLIQRVQRPGTENIKAALLDALAISSAGHPVPPLGVLADLHALLFDPATSAWVKQPYAVPGWPAGVQQRYEDFVLSKLPADWTFERASSALLRYSEAERPRGFAYLVRQLRERWNLGGVEISPAVFRTLLKANVEDLVRQGMESFEKSGPVALLVNQYEEWIRAAKRTGEVLDIVDVVAIERRVALAEMREFVAHKQVLQATRWIEDQLPARAVPPRSGRREVPTRILDEDQYPVGGYTSISNKGSIESLLHSQLAYIEDDATARPDLFDLKYVRDELFYYSRDENQFRRRRRAFLFVFDPSLTEAKVKDLELPYQRIVLACAVVLASVRKLLDWQSADAIRFEMIFPRSKGASPLTDEAKLFERLLMEERANGVVQVLRDGGDDGPTLDAEVLNTPMGFAPHAEAMSQHWQTQIVRLGCDIVWSELDGPLLNILNITGPSPALSDAYGEPILLVDAPVLTHWPETTRQLLSEWL